MSFTWPGALVALVAAPLVIVLHMWLLRRRRRSAVIVTDVALVRAAVPRSSSLRRHIPVALLTVALSAAVISAARPTLTLSVPISESAIVLALDTSSSMCNTDVEPNRLKAAQAAAREFVDGLDEGARVGLVAFNGLAGLVVPPTDDRDAVVEAIGGLTVSRGTAIGQAIIVGIDAIAETNDRVESTRVESTSASDIQPDTIVLLTDGTNSRGIDPVAAADLAAKRGIRVYTIGFGTDEPSNQSCTPAQAGADVFGGPGGGFGPGGGAAGLLQVDEATMTTVAELTGGEYARAGDADDLVDVLTGIPARVGSTERDAEISVWLALAAGMFLIAGLATSMRWTRT